MLWAPKICNTSTWGTPDDQVLIDAPELVDCRWSLCLLTVVFGQHQHQQSEKDILRRHGDYFLRRVMSPLSIKSAVQKFTEKFLVRLGNEGGKLVMDEGDIVKQPEQYRC